MLRVGSDFAANEEHLERAIWKLVASETCVPIQWIPREQWYNDSVPLFDVFRFSYVDTLEYMWFITESRRLEFNFSIPILMSEQMLMIPNRQAVDVDQPVVQFDKFSYVFSLEVWLSIFSIFLMFVFINSGCFCVDNQASQMTRSKTVKPVLSASEISSPRNFPCPNCDSVTSENFTQQWNGIRASTISPIISITHNETTSEPIVSSNLVVDVQDPKNPTNSFQQYRMSLWTWFGHWLSQATISDQPSYTSMAHRSILLLTGIFAIHSLTLYQGCLLTQLMRQCPFEPRIGHLSDIIDLIRSRRAILNLRNREFSLARSILDQDTFPELRQVLQDNPPVFFNPTVPNEAAELAKLITDHHAVVVTTTQEINILDQISHNIGDSGDEYGDCSFVTVPLDYRLPMAIMWAPTVNETVIDCVDEAITINYDRIFAAYEHHKLKQMARYNRCRAHMYEVQASKVGDPVQYGRISGIFYVILGGWTVGVLILMGELALTVRNNMKRLMVLPV